MTHPATPHAAPNRPRARPWWSAALLMWSATFAAVASGPPPVGEPLAYADALRLAADAPVVRLATRALELAERQAIVTGAPVRGELTGGYQWTWGERDPGAGAPLQDLGDGDADPIGLALSFPRLGVGASADAVARARADVARAEAELAAAHRDARIDVTNAFQRALRAREARSLAATDLELAALELGATQQRRAVGAASEPDVDRARVTEARAQAVLVAANGEVAAADRALAVALGAPVGPPHGPLPSAHALVADVAGAADGSGVDAGPLAEALVPEAPEGVGAADPWAGTRTDVLAATLGVADTDRTAAATLRDNLPSAALRVTGAYGDAERSLRFGAGLDTRSFQPSLDLAYDPDTGLVGLAGEATSRSLTVGVTVRIPLDPTVGHALAAARVGRDRARVQLDLTRATAALDVAQRRQDLADAVADADLADAAAGLALAEADLSDARFDAGGVSELARRRARLDAERAVLDAARAHDVARLAALRLQGALAADAAPLE